MGYKDKKKQREYQRLWANRRREEVLQGKSCSSCNSVNDLVVTSVDKKLSFTGNKTKLEEKIRSAKILCEDCFTRVVSETKRIENTIHGHSKRTPTYASWQNMLQRCNNPNKDNYRWYGGLGVKVCERWNKFENFLADMGDRPIGMTLDRKDPYGNYEPGNCRWANSTMQGKNKRKSLG